MNNLEQARNVNTKFKDHYILKNWYLSGKLWFHPCKPEDTLVLCGEAYEHAFYKNGRLITTSLIQKVETKEDHKEVHTLNSIYWIYPEEVNQEYKNQYPDCYNQLIEGKWDLNHNSKL